MAYRDLAYIDLDLHLLAAELGFGFAIDLAAASTSSSPSASPSASPSVLAADLIAEALAVLLFDFQTDFFLLMHFDFAFASHGDLQPSAHSLSSSLLMSTPSPSVTSLSDLAAFDFWLFVTQRLAHLDLDAHIDFLFFTPAAFAFAVTDAFSATDFYIFGLQFQLRLALLATDFYFFVSFLATGFGLGPIGP